MIRRVFTIASMMSLLLCAVAMVLGWLSYREPHAFSVHSPQGGQWYVGWEKGQLSLYNDTDRRIRALNVARYHVVERGRAWAELQAQWQRRPDRFEKSKDSLGKDRAEAELTLARDEERVRRMQIELTALAKKGMVPPIRHSIRCAVLAATAALLPLLWTISIGLARRRRASRARHSLCQTCGYDLRASTVRCPECGTELTERAKASA